MTIVYVYRRSFSHGRMCAAEVLAMDACVPRKFSYGLSCAAEA